MKKRMLVVMFCVSLAVSGCNINKEVKNNEISSSVEKDSEDKESSSSMADERDDDVNYEGENEYENNDNDINYEEENEYENSDDFYNEDEEIDVIQEKYVKGIQDDSSTEILNLLPDKAIENLEDKEKEKYLKEDLKKFYKDVYEIYGNNIKFDYSQSSFEEFDIEKLQRIIDSDDDDIDVLESLNKKMVDIIESNCNLQRCIKSDMLITISGDKNTHSWKVPSYIYEIDYEWFIDIKAFDDLYDIQERVVDTKDKTGSYYALEYDNDEYYNDWYMEEDIDYSLLLLKDQY